MTDDTKCLYCGQRTGHLMNCPTVQPINVPIDRNPHTVTLPYQLTEPQINAVIEAMKADGVAPDEMDRRVGQMFWMWNVIRRGPDYYK